MLETFGVSVIYTQEKKYSLTYVLSALGERCLIKFYNDMKR